MWNSAVSQHIWSVHNGVSRQTAHKARGDLFLTATNSLIMLCGSRLRRYKPSPAVTCRVHAANAAPRFRGVRSIGRTLFLGCCHSCGRPIRASTLIGRPILRINVGGRGRPPAYPGPFQTMATFRAELHPEERLEDRRSPGNTDRPTWRSFASDVKLAIRGEGRRWSIADHGAGHQSLTPVSTSVAENHRGQLWAIQAKVPTYPAHQRRQPTPSV